MGRPGGQTAYSEETHSPRPKAAAVNFLENSFLSPLARAPSGYTSAWPALTPAASHTRPEPLIQGDQAAPFSCSHDHSSRKPGAALLGLPYRAFSSFQRRKILQMLILKNHLRFVSLSAAMWRPRRVTREVSLALAAPAFCLALGDAATAGGQRPDGPQDSGAEAACGSAGCGRPRPLQRGLAYSPSLAQTRPPPPHPRPEFQQAEPSGPKR